ncbi:hypothetical protein GCM10009854_18170 [Saccharopolyspora halophila]|uniref:Uncharacterized protein n=1 Tax=Saccharopolyspora halophila TaxID=405551 RepID=A0ABN3G165_9PSEU
MRQLAHRNRDLDRARPQGNRSHDRAQRGGLPRVTRPDERAAGTARKRFSARLRDGPPAIPVEVGAAKPDDRPATNSLGRSAAAHPCSTRVFQLLLADVLDMRGDGSPVPKGSANRPARPP